MTTTIGRVDFLVSLDGQRLPAEARRLGHTVGKEAGDSFSKSLDSSFSDNLSKIGDRFAAQMSKDGRLAGSTFASTFEGALSTRFRKMQDNLAGILSDQDAFTEFARGFDTVQEAVDRANADLERLRAETVQYTDVNGNLAERLVLTQKQFQGFRAEVNRLGRAADEQISKERELVAATDDFNASWARLGRAVGDADVFRELADRVGGTDVAFERLRAEIDGVGDSFVKSRADVEAYIDRLEHTRDVVERTARAQNDARLLASTRALIAEFDRQDRANERAAETAARLAEEQDRLAEANRRQLPTWKDLSHNTRQWTLIIGAIAAGMEELSVLGSAAGAGLFALGGAATSGVAGIGALAAAFVTLNKDADELPAHMREVKQEFERFTPVFGELREAVAEGALAEMNGSFDLLGRSMRSLTPELTTLGAIVGNVFEDFARGTREGSAGLEEIRTSLRLAGPNFSSLADSAGTFGVAFLRSFNRAQPLVEQTLGYIDRLANQLDDFSQSSSFDDWMRNASYTLSKLSPLLDATARGLNDLVTPETVRETGQFLEDLTGFMPALSDILSVIGSLNPFGLLAQALNESGDALDPLLPALDDLAEAVSGVASDAIPVFADGLRIAASVIAPLAQGAADFIDALPPDVIRAIAAGLMGVALGFGAIRAGGAVSAAVTGLRELSAAASTAELATGGLGTKLKSALGKAGAIGIAAAGAFALTEGLDQIARSVLDLDNKTRNYVASGTRFADVFRQLNSDQQGNALVKNIDDAAAGLERLGEVGQGFAGIFSNVGLALSEGGQEAMALSGTLKELDGPLAELANNSVAAATDKFSLWAAELGATDSQVLAMIESMPQFKQALLDTALAEGIVATDAQLVALAMGESAIATGGTTDALAGLASQAGLTDDQIGTLSDSIRGFAEANFGSRDAAREYEAAIDDLSDSLVENGNTLDITTAQGRANEAAVDALAQAVLNNSAATLENTGSQEQARAVMEQGRAKLVEMMQQFGKTEAEAEQYADQLGLIPGNVNTAVALNGVSAAEQQLSILSRDRTARIFIQTNGNMGQFIQMGTGKTTAYAEGGIARSATPGVFGEAGVEMLVPLQRPLNQIDPSVRAVAAFAQGRLGELGGNSAPRVVLESGAVTVVEADDAEYTANEVVERVFERVGG